MSDFDLDSAPARQTERPSTSAELALEALYTRRLVFQLGAFLNDPAEANRQLSASYLHFDAQGLLDSFASHPDDQLEGWIKSGAFAFSRGRESLTERSEVTLAFLGSRLLMHLLSLGWRCYDTATWPLSMGDDDGPQGASFHLHLSRSGLDAEDPEQVALCASRLARDLGSFATARALDPRSELRLDAFGGAPPAASFPARPFHARCFDELLALRERADLNATTLLGGPAERSSL